MGAKQRHAFVKELNWYMVGLVLMVLRQCANAAVLHCAYCTLFGPALSIEKWHFPAFFYGKSRGSICVSGEIRLAKGRGVRYNERRKDRLC